MKHFTRKYIYYEVVGNFWFAVCLISLLSGIAIIVAMMCMAESYILKPIRQLLKFANYIMGKEDN